MDVYAEIVALRQSGRKGALATIVDVRGSIPSYESAKMLVRDDGSIAGTVGGGCVEAEVWQAAREVMDGGRPRTLQFDLNEDPKYDTGLVCGGTLQIFIEPIVPPARLYVFGAGHVAHALYQAAHLAGWEVVVADDRAGYANRERFPDAVAVLAQDYEATMAQLVPREAEALVIVTRGHHDDLRILRWAVGTPAGYIGMVGSRRKAILIRKALAEEGGDTAALERVHSPVGLAIGAVTPEEIAVSILAELIAHRRGMRVGQPSCVAPCVED